MSTTPATPDLKPVQLGHGNRTSGLIPSAVHMAAYEVYCHVYRPQPALIEGWCRGGFGTGELLAFLYARAFPKEQWSERVREAWAGMQMK